MGISTVEYLRRKENVFEYDEAPGAVGKSEPLLPP